MQNTKRNKTFFCLLDYIYYRGERITQKYGWSIWRGGGSVIFPSLYTLLFSLVVNPFLNKLFFIVGFLGVIILEIFRYNFVLNEKILFSHYKRNKWNKIIPDWIALALIVILLMTAIWFPFVKYK